MWASELPPRRFKLLRRRRAAPQAPLAEGASSLGNFGGARTGGGLDLGRRRPLFLRLGLCLLRLGRGEGELLLRLVGRCLWWGAPAEEGEGRRRGLGRRLLHRERRRRFLRGREARGLLRHRRGRLRRGDLGGAASEEGEGRRRRLLLLWRRFLGLDCLGRWGDLHGRRLRLLLLRGGGAAAEEGEGRPCLGLGWWCRQSSDFRGFYLF
mmetsp:Transcript_30676/g.98871  ORF Transcript_30676/g.98871 Transcript_30676/m.98871 type:complete len:209 (-) Transcript_30676:1255-1881(-)